MSRLPPRRNDELDSDGRSLWDAITETRGASVVDADGGLVGPFNAWMHAPILGRPMSRLGSALRFETSVDRRLIELAIITVGAHWQAEFEWWAHARMASEHGVSDEIIAAIGAGESPPIAAEDERIVYSIAQQLMASGRVGADTYDRGRQLLGDQGMVELVTLCGYYTLISFTLNAFEVPLPPGVEPHWTG